MFDVDYFHKLVCDYGISVELLHDDDNSNEYGISTDWFVGIAELELGYLEKAKGDNLDNPDESSAYDNYTKYARDLGQTNGQPWCATFVSWVARKANIPTTIIKTTAGARSMESQYKNRGAYVAKSDAGKGGYIPRKGDLAFWWRDSDGNGLDDNGSGHVGIVVAATNDKFYTIDGNTWAGDKKIPTDTGYAVGYNPRDYKNSSLLGFGVNGGTQHGVMPPPNT
jgi:hypothetical protein